jgi:hypothetical protein
VAMAIEKSTSESTSESISSDDVWTVDRAFQYLTKVVTLEDGLARYQLTEKLRADELRATTLEGVTVPASAWDQQFSLVIVDGHVVVRRSVSGLIGGGQFVPCELNLMLPAKTVRQLWPLPKAGSALYQRIRQFRKEKFPGATRVPYKDFARRWEERLEEPPPNRDQFARALRYRK